MIKKYIKKTKKKYNNNNKNRNANIKIKIEIDNNCKHTPHLTSKTPPISVP